MTDFGMARNVQQDDIYTKQSRVSAMDRLSSLKKMSYDYAKKPSLTDCCTMTRIILLKTFIFQGRLPVKWTAYESLLYGTYTTQSDM